MTSALCCRSSSDSNGLNHRYAGLRVVPVLDSSRSSTSWRDMTLYQLPFNYVRWSKIFNTAGRNSLWAVASYFGSWLISTTNKPYTLCIRPAVHRALRSPLAITCVGVKNKILFCAVKTKVDEFTSPAFNFYTVLLSLLISSVHYVRCSFRKMPFSVKGVFLRLENRSANMPCKL